MLSSALHWSHTFSYLSFALLLIIIFAPLFYLEFLTGPNRYNKLSSAYRQTIMYGAIVITIISATSYLITARPFIEGVDFFYYVCTARDALHSLPDYSLAIYYHFPGGFRFWEAVMALLGEDLATLQWTAVALLVVNALLITMTVGNALKNIVWGLAAGFWYLALATRLEGLYGTTEPITTAFALFGLLAWSGAPLNGALGWMKALLLGIALGLALWAKQQGGVIALGATSILISNWCGSGKLTHSFKQIIFIPFVAILVFLCAILLEGEGVRPLQQGLEFIAAYESQGSFTDNVWNIAQQMGVAIWIAFVALAYWLTTLLIPRVRSMHRDPSLALIGFSSFAILATLMQFSSRPYLHYALLTAPFIAMAGVLVIARLHKTILTKLKSNTLADILVFSIIAMPLIAKSPNTPYFHVWPPNLMDPVVAHEAPWHTTPEVSADLNLLKDQLKQNEDLLIVPSRRNVVHFLLGTRASIGSYDWLPYDVSAVLSSSNLSAVLVLESAFDPTDTETCKSLDCALVIDELPTFGFKKAIELKTMTLWRRAR